MSSANDETTILEAREQAVEIWGELVEIYFTDNRSKIGLIQKALQARDIKSLTHEAHAMKSSCAALGVMKVSRKAREIEIYDYEKVDWEFVAVMVQDLTAFYDESCPFLQSTLALPQAS